MILAISAGICVRQYLTSDVPMMDTFLSCWIGTADVPPNVRFVSLDILNRRCWIEPGSISPGQSNSGRNRFWVGTLISTVSFNDWPLAWLPV